MPFQLGQSGNPAGKPKGCVSGRAAALQVLDHLFNEEENRAKLAAALQKEFDKNPVNFFRHIIMPLIPREAILKMIDSTPTVVKWQSLLDTFPLNEKRQPPRIAASGAPTGGAGDVAT